MAADVDEQRRVVDVGARLLVEIEQLGHAQRDQALAQDVLHRLPEPEVDAERERRHELGEADVRAIGLGHQPTGRYAGTPGSATPITFSRRLSAVNAYAFCSSAVKPM